MARLTKSVGLRFRGRVYDDLESGLAAFKDFVDDRWEDAARVAKESMREYLNDVAKDLARRHSGGFPGGTTARSLSARSGDSVASILESVRVSGARYNTLRGTIGGQYPLMVHEYGTTVRSRGKALTIPLPPALNAKGLPLKRSARDWEHTFIGRSKNGNLLIFQKRATGIVPLYVLKTEVTIPARLGMRDTLRAGIPHFISRTVDRMVADIVR